MQHIAWHQHLWGTSEAFRVQFHIGQHARQFDFLRDFALDPSFRLTVKHCSDSLAIGLDFNATRNT